MSSSDFLVHHSIVTKEGSSPSRWMLVLHGILGSSGNFRGIARKLAESCPSWGFILVDLRGHGLSQDPPPPQTIAAAAEDLIRLGQKLALPITGVMGHSFGGKVAMAYLGLRAGELDQAWILDAGPGPHGGEIRASSTPRVLCMLEEMPMPLPSRERFVEMVLERGFDKSIADWLAMNVRRAEDGLRLRVDLSTIRALLADFAAQDLWPILETPAIARRIHIVLGGRSTSVPQADKEHYHELEARSFGVVSVHELARAGHWVHVDDPEGLLDLMRPALQL